MDRKFVIALSSLAGSMMLTEAHAIGLGEIKLRSSLNEPLRADIRLAQAKDLNENEILVNLAPQADFDRAHVDRDFLLTSLRFRLDLDDPSNPKVVVTTQQPIREPFLNFVVEVQWPSGRLLREYTLLMDLPAFAESKGSSNKTVKSSTVQPGRSLPSDDGASEVAAKSSAPRVNRPATRSDSAPAPRESEVEDGSYGPTRSNDTLWKIAQSVRNGGTVHQNMLAIQKLNPGAFSKGNINQLKKGQVLKLPSREEVSSISRADAIAKVDEQNIAWKNRNKSSESAGAQVDATGRTQESAPASTQPDGQLKLAASSGNASSQASQGAGQSSPAEVAALKNDVAASQEELNRVQRENEQNAAKAKELDSQMSNAERLLELQNNEMAAMQAKLAAEQQAKADAAATAPAAVDAQVPAPPEAAAPASAEQEATAPEAESATDAQPPAAPEATTEPAVEATPPAEPVAVAQPEKPKPEKPKPETPAPTTEAGSSNPLIGGIIAIVFVLLGLFGYRRMASRGAEKEVDVDSLVQYEDQPIGFSETEAQVERSDEFDAGAVSEVSAHIEQPVAQAPVEPAQPETGDVLGEADIYISFGNFEKAESLLRSAIKTEPQRTDLQLKLLELFKEAGDLSAFDDAYRQLAELKSDAANTKASDLRSRIAGAESVPFAVAAAAGAAVVDSGLEEDFDLGFDEVLEAAPEPAAALEEVTSVAASEDIGDFNLDLDLETDLTAASEAESLPEAIAEEPASEEFSLDFDLDLDLDLTSPSEEPVALEPAVEQPAPVTAGAVEADDEDLGFLSNADEAATKLDLARAYIDMGDKDGARDILAEVIEDGQDEQKREAQALLDSIG